MKFAFGSLLFLGFSIAVCGQVGHSRIYKINDNVELFYPAAFDSAANMPSFALVQEPVITQKLTSGGIMTPVFYTRDNHSIASIPYAKGVSLYGTGEVTGPLLRNGQKITIWNTDNYKYKKDGGSRLYQACPWVLGVNADGTAFGVLADNTWKQRLELTDSIRFISEGTPFRVLILQGKSPEAVMECLSNLIGKMALPPLWALGYQQCRFSYVPDSRVREIADTFRLKKIPCDVIWIDIDYMEHYKVFTFDKIKVPDPKGLNDYLHSRGFKSVWMIDPGVKVEKGYPVYESGTARNVWIKDATGKAFVGNVWPGACVFPDFTVPDTRKWWTDLYAPFLSMGMDGVWNDMNEPSVFNGPDGTIPENCVHRGGGTLPQGSHLRYHNVYGYLMVKSSLEGIKKYRPEIRPFLLSRSGFLGSNRFGATWTGDNFASQEYMKMSLPMVLNLGLSGQQFSGPDIGGYAGITTGGLFAQWIALGAFYPLARGHAENQSNHKEPWAFGQQVEQISRTAINRRYRLLPYLYTLFYEASVKGLPVMRPLFFADSKDTSLRREDQVFLLGADLMIIPRWAVQPSLPKEKWFSVSLANESKEDSIQPLVQIRPGSVVPLGRFIQNTTEYSTDSLTLLIALDKSGRAIGSLYEDSGNGMDYQKGDFLLSEIRAHRKGNHVKVDFIPLKGDRKSPSRKLKVIIVN